MSLYAPNRFIRAIRLLTERRHFDLPPSKANRIHIPRYVYRLVHLNSASYSRYHPDIPRELDHPNAVDLGKDQVVKAYRRFTLSDINKQTVLGHLDWKRYRAPYSPYISASDSKEATQKRARDYYNGSFTDSTELALVIQISTENLIPAVYRSPFASDILVWMSADLRPADGHSITAEEFNAADPSPELFISVSQLHGDRTFGKIFCKTFQQDEWLIASAIPQWRVDEVMPCDGEDVIHYEQGIFRPVQETVNDQVYFWHWRDNIWRKLDERGRKRKWADMEIEGTLDKDWTAKAQHRDYKYNKVNTCWKDKDKMQVAMSWARNVDGCEESDKRKDAEGLGSEESEQSEDGDAVEKGIDGRNESDGRSDDGKADSEEREH